MGLTKAVLAGGTHKESQQVDWRIAPFLVFSGFIFAPKDYLTYLQNWNSDDHTIASYIEATFPDSKLKLFIELGRNDIAWDVYNLILAPDYSLGSLIGIRKFGLFNNKQLYIGFEYFRQLYSKYDKRLKPGAGNWYSTIYDNSTYDGRFWGPHCGEDSDDFYIYTGWIHTKCALNVSFNYERHGLQKPTPAANLVSELEAIKSAVYPEVKLELVIKLKYKRNGYDLYFLFEKESLKNYEFVGNTRNGFVFIMGIEGSLPLPKKQ